jgi:hypothetical protein
MVRTDNIKHMGKKKSNIRKKNLLESYNERQTKGNVENTLLKGAVDALAGSVAGTSLGALAGDKAVIAGIALIFAGHYLGDESGLLRTTGASTLGYGIAKAKEYQNNPELATVSKRFGELKDDWLTAFHLNWKNKKKASLQTSEVSVKEVIKTPKEVVKPTPEPSLIDIPKKYTTQENKAVDQDFDDSMDYSELAKYEIGSTPSKQKLKRKPKKYQNQDEDWQENDDWEQDITIADFIPDYDIDFDSF